MDLLELDGHVAGLASAALSGGRPLMSDTGIHQLAEKLNSLVVVMRHDDVVLAGANEYLAALSRVVSVLEVVTRR